MRKQSRSFKYQYKLNELSFKSEWLDTIPDEHNINNTLIEELRSELLEEIKKVMKQCLTQNQYYVMNKYFFEGWTQIEIAKELDCVQPSVNKVIYGNNSVGDDKIYGGSIKKLRKMCEKNERILELLAEISELSDI